MVDRLRFVLWTWVVSLMYWFQFLFAIWVEAWFWLGFWNWVELILIWLDLAWFDLTWFDLTWPDFFLLCLLIYLLACLLACLFTYLLACLLIYLFTYLLACLLTCLLIDLLTSLILTWWLYLESMMIDLGKSLEIDIILIESDLIGI